MKKDNFDLFLEKMDKLEKEYPKAFNFVGYSILVLTFIMGAISLLYALTH